MLSLADFGEVWVIDCEFRAPVGGLPDPVCLVGREYHTGRVVSLWRDDLRRLLTAPFDTGPNTLVVAYFASAEVGCFLALGWPVPKNLICLYAEHRAETNGLKLPFGNSLLDAAAMRGLPAMAAATKEANRRLVMDRWAWSEQEVATILAYCRDDVVLTTRLLERMAPAIDYPRALLRGRYMTAVARMERAGVPIDTELHGRLAARWEPLKARLIERSTRISAYTRGPSSRVTVSPLTRQSGMTGHAIQAVGWSSMTTLSASSLGDTRRFIRYASSAQRCQAAVDRADDRPRWP